MKVTAEQQCGRLIRGAGGFRCRVRACFLARGRRASEAAASLPPSSPLFHVVSKQREVCWYLSARGPLRILCLKRDAELTSSLLSDTPRPRFNGKKKKKHSTLCSKEYWKLSLRLFGHRRRRNACCSSFLSLSLSGFLLGGGLRSILKSGEVSGSIFRCRSVNSECVCVCVLNWKTRGKENQRLCIQC